MTISAPEIVHSSTKNAANANTLAYWEQELDVPQAALAVTQLGLQSRAELMDIFFESAERWQQLHTDLQQYTNEPNGFSVALRLYIQRHIPRNANGAGPRFVPKAIL